jgi:hypothetical protein
MSDIPSDWRGQLDLRAELARIDRDRAETQKLMRESEKFQAEREKANRDPWVLVLAAMIGAVAVIVGRLPEILHAFGIG